MTIHAKLAFLFLSLSACRNLPIDDAHVESSKAVDEASSQQTVNSETIYIQETSDIDAPGSEPVSVGGSYLTCAKRTFDSYATYACTLRDSDDKKMSLKAEEVEGVSVLAGSEKIAAPIVWHDAIDPISFSFEDVATRTIDLVIQLKLKDVPPIQASPATQATETAPKVLYANGFENLALDSANQNNNNNSWYFAELPGWQLSWVPSQSGLALCAQLPVVEVQVENAGSGLAQPQPKPFKGLYHLELDSGCLGTITSNMETNAKLTRTQALSIGHWYSLEFAYMSRAGSSNPRFVVQLDKQILLDQTQANLPTAWTPFRYVFKATGASATFSLADMGGGNDLARGILIDELILSALD